MITTRSVLPGARTGTVMIPASKSRAHRLLIMAALSDEPVTLDCNGFSNDILATISCLNSLGCSITTENDRLIHVKPLKYGGREAEKTADTALTDDAVIKLQCRDSGSTLRFMLPLAGALGVNAVFEMEGRLPQRPLDAYADELTAHGMKLCKDGNELCCSGQLEPGDYTLPGNISSQYISGLLMSLPLLKGNSRLTITKTIESPGYIRMTEDALKLAGIRFSYSDRTYEIPGRQHCQLPGYLNIEGDWSGAAFFLCLGALVPEGIMIRGVDPDSLQGDKAIIDILKQFGADIRSDEEGIFVKNAPLTAITVDASGIPDLVPVISIVAAAARGTTRIINAGRLRLKESDRLQTTAKLLSDLGAKVAEGSDNLIVEGCNFPEGLLTGGPVSSFDDHRIAMSAAVAAAICRNPVSIDNPECVKKSFANFWEIFDTLETGISG